MPIKTLKKRLTEVGRLRLGQKVPVMDQRTGKQKIRNGQPVFRPARGQTWRVTTKHEELLQYVAGRYGGEVKPWDGAPGDEPQWELFTDSAVLEVIIPPGKLRLSQWMEAWQRNLCVRRCDTETETNSDGPCICATEAAHPKDYACQPVTRLSVMLAGIPSAGVWRAELHGIHGAEELAGMAELLEAAGAAGRIVPATLALEQRTIPAKPGQPTRHIVLAVLQPLPAWIEAQVALQATPTAGELPGPRRELEPPDYDTETGEVYEAEEGPTGGAVTTTPAPPVAATPSVPTLDQVKRLIAKGDAKNLVKEAPAPFQRLIPRAITAVFNTDPHQFWDDPNRTVGDWKQVLEYAVELHDHQTYETSRGGASNPPEGPAADPVSTARRDGGGDPTSTGPNGDGEAPEGPVDSPSLLDGGGADG